LLAFPTTHHAPLPQMTYLKESRIASRLNGSFATVSPYKQTSLPCVGTSQMCQQQTWRRFIRLLRPPDLINPQIATNAFIASHAAACTPSKLVN
jgi:hypothetical protein